MSPDILRSGAILVADAHCAPWRTTFLDFLHALEHEEILTPQLILMGDVFDLLFGPIEATHLLNAEGIALLNRLSHKIEIVYLEGNHDFLLGDLFPRIRVIPRQQQPWITTFEGKTLALSHGDSSMGWGYGLYTFLIRSRSILGTLHALDRVGGGYIVRELEKAMKSKIHCKTIEKFETLVSERLKGQKLDGVDILIEGHFHQNKSFDFPGLHYINLAAFACNERYFSVQSSQNQPLLHEAVFRKEPR
jgi:UDP-2,3-diacylglucosamine hydrolase